MAVSEASFIMCKLHKHFFKRMVNLPLHQEFNKTLSWVFFKVIMNITLTGLAS